MVAIQTVSVSTLDNPYSPGERQRRTYGASGLQLIERGRHCVLDVYWVVMGKVGMGCRWWSVGCEVCVVCWEKGRRRPVQLSSAPPHKNWPLYRHRGKAPPAQGSADRFRPSRHRINQHLCRAQSARAWPLCLRVRLLSASLLGAPTVARGPSGRPVAPAAWVPTQ